MMNSRTVNMRRRLAEIERKRHEARMRQPPAEWQALERTLAALMALSGPCPSQALAALVSRMDAKVLTDADRQMLASLPRCHMAPGEVVRLAVGVRDRY